MRNRWANDVAAGLLVTAIGSLAVAVTLFFGLSSLAPFAFGVIAIGAGIALFGGFEYFNSKTPARVTDR